MRVWPALVLVALSLAACGGPAPTPTINAPATQTRTGELAILATAAAPTATATATLTPTATPTPVPTNTPTATPVPTATATPTAVPTFPRVVLPTVGPTNTPAPKPAYTGARWHGIPTPGGPTIYKEEVAKVSLLVRGTFATVEALYLATLEMDGYLLYNSDSNADATGYRYAKDGVKFFIGFAKKQVDGNILVLIDDSP